MVSAGLRVIYNIPYFVSISQKSITFVK